MSNIIKTKEFKMLPKSTTIISKMLLSEVCDCDCIDCYFDSSNNLLHFTYEYDVTSSDVMQSDKSHIDIFKLAFICKEWAFNQGYIIEIGVHPTIQIDKNNKKYFYSIKKDSDLKTNIIVENNITIITEQEAIFAACEWILKDLKC